MGGRSQRFEMLLDNARGAIERARQQRSSVADVPDEFVAAIQGFERRLEDLESVGRIRDDDLREAKTVYRHAALLDELLASLGQLDADLMEYEVERLRVWVDHCSRLVDKSDGGSLHSALSDLQTDIGLLETLVDSGKHARVRSNEQLTAGDVDRALRTFDAEARETATADAYRAYCVDATQAFLDRIHDTLGELRETHPKKTAFRDDLQLVRQNVDSAESGDMDAGRIALEGAMMIYTAVVRAVCRQAHADRLVEAIREHDLPTEDDPAELAADVEVEALVDAIAAGVSDEVDQSRTTRFRRLLAENDGSIRQTVQSSEYHHEEAFDLLRAMYEADHLYDVTVRFEP